MEQKKQLSKYRWVILAVIVPVIIATEMMWLSLAPVSSKAVEFYGVSSMKIDLLSISYMVMFIVFSIPASWVIDRFGFRTSLIIGASLTGVFGMIRGLFGDRFEVVLIAQFLIAVGQPFLLNISTKVPANWFPRSERSTAAGILTMAQYAGFAVPMLISPLLVEKEGIQGLLMLFAWIGVVASVVAIVFTREKPKIEIADQEPGEETMSLSGIFCMIKNKSYVSVLVVCFISIGIFNTILTLLEMILLPRGIQSFESGIVGAIFVVAGVIGAVILPILSDHTGKRIPFLIVSIILLIPAYLGFTFVSNFVIIAIIAGVAGFFIMGVAPILFQHGSEVAYPVKEGTSLGMILLMGQISGVLIVYVFEVLKGISGNVIVPMLCIVAATVIELPIVIRMKESAYHTKA